MRENGIMVSKTTTAGALLIKSMLPTQAAKNNYDLHRILDKGGMSGLINELIKHGGDKAFDTINVLARMFFEKATHIGATTPLTDYENDSDERQALFGEFEQKVKAILQSKLEPKVKTQRLDELAAAARKKLNSDNLRYLVARGSMAAKMAQSGARGNPDQLGIGTASPLMAYDVKGNPIPTVIKHSFAEGLSPAEFYAMSYGGRASTVLTQLSTEKPGALFKKLTPSMFHEVITMTDCGTKNGLPYPANDSKAIIGRYEAGTSHLIDENYYNQIKSRKFITVRSPMTCHAHEGVCQKCYGIAANGRLPDIGENVGVIAAQSVSEVLTQAMLATKHQGGVAGGQRNVFEEANNLLSNPRDNFQDESTIATVNGKVTAIKQTPLKDWEIYVGDKSHFVSREQEPVVDVGGRIRIGDPLSTGTINPRKLVELKGAGAGRLYLANKLREVYTKKAPGLDPRHFELISKNMIRYAEVNDPGESDYMPGQSVDMAHIHQHLAEHAKVIPLTEALDKTLAHGVLELTPGTVLTGNHIEDLKRAGVHTVHISTSNIKITPEVPGLQTVKLLDNNWVSNLSFARLKKVLQDAPALGQHSSIHSTDPITPYIIGTEFGEGEKGRY
jgi:DNA-directed RNA polymerase subunit beta'